MHVHCTCNESGSQLDGPILMNDDVVIDVVKAMVILVTVSNVELVKWAHFSSSS